MVFILLFIIVLLCKHILGEKTRRENYEAQRQYARSSTERKKLKIQSRFEAETTKIKKHFELVGSKKILEEKLLRREKELEELKKAKQECDSTIENMNESLKKYQKMNFELGRENRQLEHKLEYVHGEKRKCLDEMQQKLEAERSRMSEMKGRVTCLERTLEEEKEENESLKCRISDLEKDLCQVSQQKEAVNQQREVLEQEGLEKDHLLSEMQGTLTEKETKNRTLCECLSKRERQIQELQKTARETNDKHKKEMHNMMDNLRKSRDECLGYKSVIEECRRDKDHVVNEHRKLMREIESSISNLNRCCEEIHKVADNKKEHERDKKLKLEYKKKLEDLQEHVKNAQ